MELDELFDGLDRHRGSFPEGLVAEAIARRDEVIPRLLEVLEDIDRNPEPWLAGQDSMIHIYALYLLALYRETRAYPLRVRLFSCPGEFAFDLAGDVVLEDLGRMLASVCGGDTSGITALIEDENANGYVRAVAMDRLVSLVHACQKTREEVMGYFLGLFQRLVREPGEVWDGLAKVCADLWPQEAMEQLRLAYEEGLVDDQVIDRDEIQEVLALGKERAIGRERYREPLITDLAEAMGRMQCFQPSAIEDQLEDEAGDTPLELGSEEQPVTTFRRAEPKVGRNERCPCGSGRKFKKCYGIVN